MALYYHDVHIEKTTERKQTALGKATFIISVAMAILFFVYGFFTTGAFFLCFLFAGLSFFCAFTSRIDFELDYTNGTLEIARIYNRSRRKTLLSIEAKDIVVLAVSKSAPVQKYIGSSMKTYDCTAHDGGTAYYCMIFTDPETRTEEKLLFEPGDELLAELKRLYPDRIFRE